MSLQYRTPPSLLGRLGPVLPSVLFRPSALHAPVSFNFCSPVLPGVVLSFRANAALFRLSFDVRSPSLQPQRFEHAYVHIDDPDTVRQHRLDVFHTMHAQRQAPNQHMTVQLGSRSSSVQDHSWSTRYAWRDQHLVRFNVTVAKVRPGDVCSVETVTSVAPLDLTAALHTFLYVFDALPSQTWVGQSCGPFYKFTKYTWSRPAPMPTRSTPAPVEQREHVMRVQCYPDLGSLIRAYPVQFAGGRGVPHPWFAKQDLEMVSICADIVNTDEAIQQDGKIYTLTDCIMVLGGGHWQLCKRN